MPSDQAAQNDAETFIVRRMECIVSDDGIRTESSIAQRNVELSLLSIDAKRRAADEPIVFGRSAVEAYLRQTITEPLPAYFISLDASQPWLCYWILHGLNLLTADNQPPVDSGTSDQITDFLQRCSHADGGYGGGPGQSPHLATTYAAVNALATIGKTGECSHQSSCVRPPFDRMLSRDLLLLFGLQALRTLLRALTARSC